MPQIWIEGRAYAVKEGQNLLQAVLGLGFNLPYFCWHPALGSVGACRQCAVKQFKDEHDARGRLVMACMTPVAEGLRTSIVDPEAVAFRAAVTEWLMTNHPHDCPVCDEGGECHLQDMTVMTGHTRRRYRFRKRTFHNQQLGSFLNHEMNRCIQCFRCVRYYGDYAGGRDLQPLGSRNRTYFGRMCDGTLESPFSGNLIEVCPTGVFTDRTAKPQPTRKWDLQTAPSICVHCGLGCNTLPGERYGELRRILNRYHGAVNGYFLCDRGRFGHGFVGHARRVREPQVRDPGAATPRRATSEEAVARARALLRASRGMIGIGSPRASLESNFALRALVGAENFCNGLSRRETALADLALRILRAGPAAALSLREVEQADAALILGEDPVETAPRLGLALRQTARRAPSRRAETLGIPAWNDIFVRLTAGREKGPIFIISPAPTALDEVAREALRALPEQGARLGCAIAHALDPEAPVAPDLSADEQRQAQRIATELERAERPVVVAGAHAHCAAVLEAAANVATALCRRGRPAGLALTLPECNTLGVALMAPEGIGLARRALTDGRADTLIVLENDLERRLTAEAAGELLALAQHVIVIDALSSELSAQAEVVLPAATFAECGGTFVSSEGRAQRFFPVLPPADAIRAGWRWLREMGGAEDRGGENAALLRAWETVGDVTAALADALPDFATIRDAAPGADYRVVGQKIPRQPSRVSGRTAILAHRAVSEPKPPQDDESPLAYSPEGFAGQPAAALITRYWAPGWNSVQALNKFQEEIGGPLRGGDPGCRILAPPAHATLAYFPCAPAPKGRVQRWCAVALYHIFGSEETSALAPAIAALAPAPYIALNASEAAALGAAEGEAIELRAGGRSLNLPLQILAGLADGAVGLPVGLPGSAGASIHALWLDGAIDEVSVQVVRDA